VQIHIHRSFVLFTTQLRHGCFRAVVPNLFDLATPFEILHARSTPATIYNSTDARITTDKIRNTIVSRVGFTVFQFLCKTKQHVCYNQWVDWACICTTSLETLGCTVCWRVL